MVRRGAVLGLVGVAPLAAGYLIGSNLGNDTDESEFGSAPATLTTDRHDVQVPRFAAWKRLPSLTVTSIEITTTESVESESPEPPVAAPTEDKTSVNPPPSTTRAPEPDITVGEEE